LNLAASLLAAGLGAVHGWLALRAVAGMSRVSRLQPKPPGRAERVSIVVAARNERGRVGRCVRSLLSQGHREVEVILVDDGSTDGTAAEALKAAARDPRFTLVRAPRPPEGWLGKPWACWMGFSRSSGEILLFVDADVEVEDWAIPAVISEVQGADAVTVSPTYICSGPAGAAELAVAATIRMFFPQWRVGSPDERSWGFGGFFAVRRSAYLEVGGHEAVRGSPVEDRDLVRLLASRGHRLRIVRGCGAVRSTWAASLGEALDSIARISSRDAPVTPWRAAAVCAALGILYAAPPLAALAAAAGLVHPVAAALALAAELIHGLTPVILGEVEADPLSAALFPLGGLAVAAGLWRAHLYRAGRRCLRWRGREICPSSSAGG